jgi:hypothetical protein
MRRPRHEPVVAPEFGDAALRESEKDFVARDRAQSEKHLSTDVSALAAADEQLDSRVKSSSRPAATLDQVKVSIADSASDCKIWSGSVTPPACTDRSD